MLAKAELRSWVPSLLAMGAGVSVVELQVLTVLVLVTSGVVVATPGFWGWSVLTALVGIGLGAVVAGSFSHPTDQLEAVARSPLHMVPPTARALLHLFAGIVVGFAAASQGLLLALLAGGGGPNAF